MGAEANMGDPGALPAKRSLEKKDRGLDQTNAVGAQARTHSQSMATIQDDDERLLARIGYRQVRSMLR